MKRRKSSARAQAEHAEAVAAAPVAQPKCRPCYQPSAAFDTPPTVRMGDVIKLMGGKYVVAYVNCCRAMCLPVNTKQVEVKRSESGHISFWPTATGVAENISPRSAVDVLCRLSVDEMAALFGAE